MESIERTFTIHSENCKVLSSQSFDLQSLYKFLNTTEVEGVSLDENTTLYIDGIANIRKDKPHYGFCLKKMLDQLSPWSPVLWGDGVVVTTNDAMNEKTIKEMIVW